MKDEKKYPIYRISARWDQNDYKDNSTSFYQMYKEDPGFESVVKKAKEWWVAHLDEKPRNKEDKPLKEKNPKLKELKAEFVEKETWCLTWFSHYTYNIHLSDEKLRESFGDFIFRKEKKNVESGHFRNEINMNKKDTKGYYCLMGAEDRWRWKGPCHCKHCIKRGLTRIDH